MLCYFAVAPVSFYSGCLNHSLCIQTLSEGVNEMIILGLLFLTTIAIVDEDDLYIGRDVSIALLCIPLLYALIFISIRPFIFITSLIGKTL